jgi:hypothetical protein
MEKGFFHPDLGYWQTLSSHNLPTFPVGTVEVPLKPGSDFEWDGKSWIKQAPNLEVLATEARAKRNSLLARSDWTQVVDAPVDQLAWATYRQELRNVPEQPDFPETINWPVAPH